MESSTEEPADKSITTHRAGILKRILNRGCVHIENLTGGLLKVSHKPATAKRVIDSIKMGAGADLSSGLHASFHLIMKELEKGQVGALVIEPTAVGKTVHISVEGNVYISIQRLDEKGHQLDQWDCIDMLVTPGRKVRVKGTASPAAVLLSRA